MQQTFSRYRDGVSLLARTFRPALSAVMQASRLSRRIGIFACFETRRLGSLQDNSGWKPKLLCG